MNASEFEAIFEKRRTSLRNRIWGGVAEAIAWTLAIAIISAEIVGLVVIAGWLTK